VSLSRRYVLRFASLLATSGGAAAVAAACGGAPASPTAAPKAAEPTKPAAPAATTAPAAAPTTAPAAKPTEAAKPAEPTKPAAAPAATATAAPAAAPGQLKQVPRNRTLRVGYLGDRKWIDAELWNPYAVGANHQTGSMLLYEPLAYYSAFADKMHYWLAESHQYSPDFKQLTIKTRSGITWSDGKPFSAEDIAYTFTALKDLGSKVRWGADVQQFVETATATDANTVVIKFKVPAPRFFFYTAYKFDIGIYPVPKHIFEGQDWTKFTHFDLAKGWPVTTGPWKVVGASPDGKIIDRRDDWWAVKAGLAQLPKVERIIKLTGFQEQQLVTSLISNELDHCMPIVNSYKAILPANPKITTFSGRKPPYGYKDWWPLSLYVNNEKKPFDDPDVRWALSYFLNRKQIIEVSYEGANEMSRLPMPDYPPLKPYFDVVKDLLEKYDTNAYDPAKGAELLTKKGWQKQNNVWTKDGQPLKMEILGFPFLSALGPVVAQQLKNQGVDATYAMPPNAGDLFTKGEYVACLYGHGGSVSDPYETLRLYQSSSVALPGAHQSNFARWKNADYDKIVDAVYVTPMEDKQKLLGLFRQAMEIWLPNLPDIQLVHLFHTIARNETYWTGWPSEQDPYVNEASWHLTWPLVLNRLQPTQ
jgi:peptide/nickel transport system substrate-binding protein